MIDELVAAGYDDPEILDELRADVRRTFRGLRRRLRALERVIDRAGATSTTAAVESHDALIERLGREAQASLDAALPGLRAETERTWADFGRRVPESAGNRLAKQ